MISALFSATRRFLALHGAISLSEHLHDVGSRCVGVLLLHGVVVFLDELCEDIQFSLSATSMVLLLVVLWLCGGGMSAMDHFVLVLYYAYRKKFRKTLRENGLSIITETQFPNGRSRRFR
jgi:hypothetical protein